MKRVKIISDITFDLVIKKINSKNFIIQNYIYTESIISSILSSIDHLKETDILVIHFDCFFHRYKNEFLQNLLLTIEGISNQFSGNILLSNSFRSVYNSSILKTSVGQEGQFMFLNKTLIEKLTNTNNVFMYDFSKIVNCIGSENAYNYNLGHLYQMPYTKKFIDALSSEIQSYIDFLLIPEKKVIFVDCDNTLWNGIIGEDGLEGIECDKNASGILFYYFQEFLLQKKKHGFLLGLSSKNNEQDVKEAFDRLNMPLKWDDFIIKKVNWEKKPDNLRSAAAELNLGTEAFILIDDSDFELKFINSVFPEIKTIKFTKDFESFLNLTDDFVFKRKVLTQEDIEKNAQYIAEQKRNSLKTKLNSFDEYIKTLEIKLDIFLNNKNELTRLSQMTEKTNQFNFNKEYFTVNQLEKFKNDKNLIYGLKVTDKFSDYGTVGLMLIKVHKNNAILYNYLLSCRALGRNIEYDFFQSVMEELKKNKIKLTSIVFKETSKNVPAKKFYQTIKI